MNFEKFILKNGIRVILVPLKNTKSVAIYVGVKVGSFDESKNINGLSHFLEHMMFKGTKNRPNTLAIAQELDSVGGEYNAYTGKEITAYYVKVLSKHLELAIDVLSDILQNSLFDEEEINREKGVIIEEINLYQDTPSRYIGDLFEKTLWGNSALGREIIGTKDNILKFKRQDFLNHLNNFYVGKNIVITVAGNFQKEKTLALLDKKFSKIKKRSPNKLKNIPKVKTASINFLNKETDQTHIAIGFETFPITDRKKYAASLLAVILGGNMSSRFFINIREKLGLCYYIFSEAEHYLNGGYFATFAGVKNENLEVAVKKIIEGYNELIDFEIAPKELQKAKLYLKGKMLLSLEQALAQAEFFARQEVLLKEILTYREIFEIINSLKPNDLQKIWRDIFSFKKLKIACIGPAKNQKILKQIMKKVVN